jgi:cysteine desulfurase
MGTTDKIIHLDNNSTTPCDPAVIDAMLPFFSSEFGNAGSQHVLGRSAAGAVERARGQVADLIGCAAVEIVFTSGATESCNLVILGLFTGTERQLSIVASAVEHKAVLGPCEHLESHGANVLRIPVGRDGVVDLDGLREMAVPGIGLISVQAANNEVGVLQPLADVAEVARSSGALFHCDAAQALGKVRFDVGDVGIDYASFSAHKVYGPKGIGALFVRADVQRELAPVLFGGGQEGRLRPGTLNVPAIVGFGEACRIAQDALNTEAPRIARLRDAMERNLLAQIPGTFLNGGVAPRLPGTCSITIPNVPADIMIANLPNVCISNGSACNSGALSPSHVLLAMGLARDEADCTLRISLGRRNCERDVRVAVRSIVETALRLQREIG